MQCRMRQYERTRREREEEEKYLLRRVPTPRTKTDASRTTCPPKLETMTATPQLTSNPYVYMFGLWVIIFVALVRRTSTQYNVS